ncbi:MAG: sigma-E processing peptidase SpoIIGA [Lachnospiraceae bacterium]
MFYADTYCFLNGVMNLSALVLTAAWGGYAASIRRISIVSLVFALIETILVVVVQPFEMNVRLNYMIMIPALLILGLNIKKLQDFFKELLRFYMVFLLLGGFLNWIWKDSFTLWNMLLSVGVETAILVPAFILNRKQKLIWNQTCNTIIKYGNIELQVKAFYDTGNLLTEPYHHRPVSILSKEAGKPILESYLGVKGMIPYHTIAQNGMMETVIVDEIRTEYNRKVHIVEHAVIGFTQETIIKNNCQLILNAAHLNH